MYNAGISRTSSRTNRDSSSRIDRRGKLKEIPFFGIDGKKRSNKDDGSKVSQVRSYVRTFEFSVSGKRERGEREANRNAETQTG